MFSDFYAAGKWAIKNADKLPVETLLVHGADDGIISSHGTVEFTENSKGLANANFLKTQNTNLTTTRRMKHSLHTH